MALTPLSIDLMGWRGSGGLGAASVYEVPIFNDRSVVTYKNADQLIISLAACCSRLLGFLSSYLAIPFHLLCSLVTV